MCIRDSRRASDLRASVLGVVRPCLDHIPVLDDLVVRIGLEEVGRDPAVCANQSEDRLANHDVDGRGHTQQAKRRIERERDGLYRQAQGQCRDGQVVAAIRAEYAGEQR